MGNNEQLITFTDAQFGYGKKTVLKNCNFSINKNDFLAFLGPNGAGKTTLLRSILQEIKPKSGKITIKNNLRIGYVPQLDTEGSYWPLKVIDFINLFVQKGCCDISAIMNRLGIFPLKDKLLQNLSGGQRQRVQLAKALVNKPDFLILDEPTDGMDVSAEADYLELLIGLNNDGMTIVLVSHHLYDVLSVAKQILIVKDGETILKNIEALIGEKVLDGIYNRRFISGMVGYTPVIVPAKETDND